MSNGIVEMLNSSVDTSQLQIRDLPDELILTIFSHLPVYFVKSTLSVVCSRWYELTQMNSLFKSLEVRPSLNKSKVVGFIKTTKDLRKLKMISRNDANEILEEIIPYLFKLRKLKITSSRESRYTSLNSDLLLQVLRQCTDLNSLSLKRVNFSEPEVFFTELGTLGLSLKKINFNHCTQLGTSALEKLVSCHPLEEARIYALEFNRVGSVSPYEGRVVNNLCVAMKHTLKVLKLNMLGVGDDAMPAIASCTKLKRLFMYRCIGIQDEGLKAIYPLQLDELLVTVPRAVTAACWSELFSQPTYSKLKKLNISNSCTVDDSVLKAIANNLNCLVCLGLPGCRQFSDQGALEVISLCNKLTLINFFSTKASVSAALRFIPTYLPCLRTVIYRSNEPKQTCFQDILKDMPNLEIRENYRYS